ncbi:ABC transporter ATP-binding protein [Pseudovibrio denitrificans]|uniref:ABC transporter ATP-binding protein n=1 Tax=Pseudovibrio denitrificans TaxID=258256 RepID=UPI001AD8BCE9|nr:ABC transporter ATP-binding protein [Pseudovibrio denitrificans]
MSIVLSNVTSGYEEFSLQSINLTIQKGSYAALIGPNGCGKSTLLKTIGQINKLNTGSITVDGKEIHRLPAKTVARQIAFLPQSPVVPTGINVEQLVGYGRAPHQSILGIRSRRDVEIVEEALHTSGLYSFKDRALKDLSGGQRQRLSSPCVWLRIRPTSCWTNPPAIWISAISTRRWICSSSSTVRAARSSSSFTTSPRHRATPITSSSCETAPSSQKAPHTMWSAPPWSAPSTRSQPTFMLTRCRRRQW